MTSPRAAERGASAVEYGLLVALLASVIIFAVLTFGGGVTDLFDEANASLGTVVSP